MKQRTGGVTFRIDREGIRENSDGSIEVPADLSIAGVFEYHRDGKVVRELRTEDELLSEASLDGMRNVLVTVDHPPEFLSTDNWREHSVGHVSHVLANPPKASGRLRIFDKDAIHQITGGHITEVSGGFGMVPRASERQDADIEQTNLTWNHFAVGPDGWSRCGTQLRLDSNDNEVLEHFTQDEEQMDEIKEVLEALKAGQTAINERLDALEVKPDEQPTEDSPIHKEEVLPDAEHIDSMVKEQAVALLNTELSARDAAQEILGWRWDEKKERHVRSETYRVDPVLCARRLVEDVLRTVDSDTSIEDGADLTPYLQQATLLAKQSRRARLSKLQTKDSIRQQLTGAPAHLLETKKSRVRFPGVHNEG